MRIFNKAAAALLAFAISATGVAVSQSMPEPLPARVQTDGNGVDLTNGSLHLATPGIAVGQAGAGGLGFSMAYSGNGWRSTMIGSIYSSGSSYTVSAGTISEEFTESGGSFTSVRMSGATLTYDSGSGGVYTYTSRDGTVSTFSKSLATDTVVDPSSANEGILVQTTSPNGVVTDYNYVTEEVVSGQTTTDYSRLQSVTNNLGYQIHFEYQNNSDPESSGWTVIDTITAINNAVDYCAPDASACTGLTKTWPTLEFTYSSGMISAVEDVLGRVTEYSYTSGKLTGIEWPSSSTDNVTIGYNGSGQVSSVDRGFGTWTYSYSGTTTRTTTVTNPESETLEVVSDVADGLIDTVTDGLSRVTEYEYDPNERLEFVIYPEGNKVQYSYDGRGNVEEIRVIAKSGSGLSDIVTSATFPSSCSNQKTCNKPTTTTDARGQATDYTYDSNHGGVTSVKAPNGGSGRPETRFTYAEKQARYKDSASTYVNGSAIYVLTESSACATTASCDGGSDETVTTIAYPTTSSANNLLPLSVTAAAGNSAVFTTSAFTYDHNGDVETIDGPLSGAADTTKFYYDAARQQTGVVGPDPDGGGSLKYRAVKATYNTDGLPTIVERGTTTSQSASAFTSFSVIEKQETVYDIFNRAVEARVYDGGAKKAVSQISYDDAGRVECAALRMNPSAFGGLGPACTPGTPGTYGGDRITNTVYDNAGQAIKTISAYGTSLAQDTVTRTFTSNGLVKTLTDAKGNKTTYTYDGHDRLVKTEYPHPATTGSSNSSDYESITYHNSGSDKTLIDETRRRDGSVYAYSYDGLARVTGIDAPGSEPDTGFTYDHFGRTLTVSRNSQTLTYAYDQLSRLLSEAGPLGTVSYDYDAAGRRTKMTWPDSFYVNYDYDTSGAVTKIRENGASSGIGVLATFTYDDLGRRVSIARGNSVATGYGFDALSRLTSLTQDINGTSDDQSYGFSYNPASQITQRTETNIAWNWTPLSDDSISYTVDGLNQYLTAGSTTPDYDANGNLTDYGVNDYTYDSANRLTSASAGGTTVNFAYDPANRLYETAGAATTRFLYDGADMIAEYNTSGTVLRRYVHGPGMDEPLVWYEGSGTTARKWLLTDTRGSIVAVADASGDAETINKYDPYGAPSSSNAGRFQYTGQMFIGDDGVDLYYYKARFYSAELGTFLQTDPIGYGSGMNLYGYVGGDPVNYTDPWGLDEDDTIVVKAIPLPCRAGAICVSGDALSYYLDNPIRIRGIIGFEGRSGANTGNRPGRPGKGENQENSPPELKPSDGRSCNTLSASNRTWDLWSQADVPYTLEIYWSSVSPLPGGAQEGGRAAPSFPGVDVRVEIRDPRDIPRNPDYNRAYAITPASREYNPRKVTLPYGGDLTIRFQRRETTPSDAEVTVCATTRTSRS